MFDAFINFLHLMATALWLGGAAYAHFILIPSLKEIDPQQSGKLQGIIAKRFSIMAWGSIITLLVTGFLKTPSDLLFDTTSEMGQVLLVKHLLIALILIVGVTIGAYVVPNMRKRAPAPGQAPTPEFMAFRDRLGRLATINLVLGVLVVFCASMLW
jgi:uncharacterized membrane protein